MKAYYKREQPTNNWLIFKLTKIKFLSAKLNRFLFLVFFKKAFHYIFVLNKLIVNHFTIYLPNKDLSTYSLNKVSI